jgi:hypothetical protein
LQDLDAAFREVFGRDGTTLKAPEEPNAAQHRCSACGSEMRKPD